MLAVTDTTTLGLSLIVAVVAPMVLAFVNSYLHRKDREQEYARQDELVARTERASALAQAAAKSTDGKLDVIHTLVNSNMTAAMQAEYDATVALLRVLTEVAHIGRAEGRTPTDATLATIETTEIKVRELGATLDERKRQTEIAENQVAQGAAGDRRAEWESARRQEQKLRMLVDPDKSSP